MPEYYYIKIYSAKKLPLTGIEPSTSTETCGIMTCKIDTNWTPIGDTMQNERIFVQLDELDESMYE